jgi:hypothetical protein
MNRYVKSALLFFLVVNFQLSIVKSQAPPPPPQNPDVENKNTLLEIDSTLETIWNHKNYCTTTLSSELFTASSFRGNALLSGSALNDVKASLVALDTIGVKGVSLTINYPILVTSFPNSAGYLSFYQQVVQEIRKKGLKLLISSNASWSDTLINKLDADNFCLNMTNMRYKTEKTQMMQTIIDSLKPDYLTIENEPTTGLRSMGMNYTIDSLTSYVNYFVNNLDKKQTKIGSGSGTWENLGYLKNYAKISSLDYLDMHIAPIYFKYFIKNSVTIDSLAKANNKKVIIGSSWLYKANDAEVTYDTLKFDEVISRNALDNYASCDSLFILNIFKLSNILKIQYTSFNWTQFLFGYINYVQDTINHYTPVHRLDSSYALSLNGISHKNLTVPGKLLKSILKLACVNDGIISPEGLLSPSVEIYPNPVSDNLNINIFLPHSQPLTVKIVDMQGKVLFNADKSNLNRGNNLLSIDTRRMNDGIYILLLQNSNYTITKRFVTVRN